MTSFRAAFAAKAVFLVINALLSGMLCWEMSARGKLFVLALPLAGLFCLWRRTAIPHALAALGAALVFFGYQSYSAHAQVLHYLVSTVSLLLLAVNAGEIARPSHGPLRLWLLGFVGVMLAGLPLMPLGECARAIMELGPLGGTRMLAYSVAKSSFYALAALDRLVLYAMFAWELSRLKDDRAVHHVARGVAASLPAALVFGLAEYFLARGKAYAMSDRLTSLFLNPGWFAEYVCLGFPLLFLLGRRKGPRLLYLLLAVTLAAMVLTMARAAWLLSGGLAVACVVAGISRFDLFTLNFRRMVRGVLLGGTVVAVVSLGLYGALSFTRISLLNFPLATMISQRLERFSETPRPLVFLSGVLIGMESPVSGMGYETYAWHYPHLLNTLGSSMAERIPRDAEAFEATHNLFIQIFAGGGLLGLTAWLFLAGRAAQLALRAHRRRADAMSLAVLFSLAAFHGFGFFQEMIYIPAVWLLFFVILAWCLRVEDSDGGWTSRVTGNRAAALAGMFVLAALLLNARNAGFAATAAGHGLSAYPPRNVQDTQGLSGPEQVNGIPALWSSGASSFMLMGNGPWVFKAGVPHPDLAAHPVTIQLSSSNKVLCEAVLDGSSGREAELVIPQGEAVAGQRVYLSVSRPYCPLVSGVKDYRCLGAWVQGEGITK